MTAVRALDAISADFAVGQFTAIMGPSGSGKSTLLHCLAGLDRLTEGRVLIGSRDLGSLDDKAMTVMRREHIGFVFQAFNLLPTLTAQENVVLPLSLGGRKPDSEWVAELARSLTRYADWETKEPRPPLKSLREAIMWRVTVKGVVAHRLRYALTALAVLLGVAFIAAPCPRPCWTRRASR